MAATTTLRARWIFPVAGPPIADGAIEVGPDRRIAAIHRRAPQGAIDFGDVAIVPGFVNVHTHLEFSDLRQPLTPALPFTGWIRSLLKYRRESADRTVAIKRGLDECADVGTAAVGEIATQDDWPFERSASIRSPRLVVFRELIGIEPEKIDERLEAARRFLEEGDRRDPSGDIRGLSPHAPYTVHPRLFEGIIRVAEERCVPVTLHLAETQAELELLREGRGELVDFLSELGVWREGVFSRGTRPLDLLGPLASVERVIIAHGNYLDDEELEFVAARRNLAVAFCPRTHAFFGHENHPWRALIAKGAIVAVGTDGRCSNPDLNVWNELLWLHARFPAVDPALLLQMGTRNGARALGLESEFGSIEIGKAAQTAVVRLGDPGADDPYAALFHPASRVIEPAADAARQRD